mgnify:CR=1 FL=1
MQTKRTSPRSHSARQLPRLRYARPLQIDISDLPAGLSIHSIRALSRRDALVELIRYLGGLEVTPLRWRLGGLSLSRRRLDRIAPDEWRVMRLGGIDGHARLMDKDATQLHISPEGVVILEARALVRGRSGGIVPIETVAELIDEVRAGCPYAEEERALSAITF